MVRILLSRKLGELRLTQADLARKTGIRPSTIGAYYNELTKLLMYAPDSDPVVRSMNTGRIMSGDPTVDE